MPKESRLTREEMDAFFASRPRRVSGQYFDLAYTPRSKGVKSACVVSKKTTPLAVGRNKIRRRVRSILAARLSALQPCALVFTARAGAARADFASTTRDIEALVSKAGLSYNTLI
jgi:ribonuclease P protein component